MGRITSRLIHIMQGDSVVKNANPENALKTCLDAWKTKASVGPGILFSRFEFKPKRHETWLMRQVEIESAWANTEMRVFTKSLKAKD